MQPHLNKGLALIMNVIPGLGHYYWGRRGRALLYPVMFFGLILFGFVLGVATRSDVFFLGLFGALLVWGVSMMDLLIALLRHTPTMIVHDEFGRPVTVAQENRDDTERFYTILLSFIPGLGHLQLGLMQRGLSFLISFFGLATILLFLAGLTNVKVFLLFFGMLPIIWLYCMFDVVQLSHRKQAGEELQDRTLFEELESGREGGRRSKVFATLLSAFPGAGHMYLGLQKRGLQMMLLFLGSIYVLDVLRLSLFLFLIPVIWFYCFFDGLQQASRYEREPLRDIPLMKGLIDHHRWIGLGLIVMGLYFISSTVVLPYLDALYPKAHLSDQIRNFLKTAIVSVLLIGGGIKVMMGSKRDSATEEGEVHE